MSNDDLKRQHQAPEGLLLERALRAKNMSQRELARVAEISEGRVRQIVNGYKSEGGQVIQIRGPGATVAKLADAAGVGVEALRNAGRQDAAEELMRIELERERDATTAGGASLGEHIDVEAMLGFVETISLWLPIIRKQVPDLAPDVDRLTGELLDLWGSYSREIKRRGGDGDDQDDDGQGAAPNTSPGSDDGPGSVAANLPTIGQRERRVGKVMPRAARPEDDKQ